MTGEKGSISPDMADLASIEDQLVASLLEASDEIAHTECLDDEQRSEIYTILQALKSVTRDHRALVELLASKLKVGSSGDA